MYVSRVIEFTGVVASQASGGTQVVAVEELVRHLAEWTEAADHVARWRACQLLLAVLEKLPEEGISDELMDQCQEVLLARLDDTKAAVRVAAARALHRLAQPGDVSIESALRSLIGAGKLHAHLHRGSAHLHRGFSSQLNDCKMQELKKQGKQGSTLCACRTVTIFVAKSQRSCWRS